MDMEAGRAKVRRYKNSISRRSHRREKARGLQLNRVKVCERLLAKALHNVLVVLHHVRRHGAVKGAGHLDGDYEDPDDVERCRRQIWSQGLTARPNFLWAVMVALGESYLLA